jgi:glycosyltransferase involved in cell wall biosynthesis
MRVAAIISTYNNPKWLQKVLWGFSAKIVGDFEIIIADDGSTEETAALIEQTRSALSQPLLHVWHEDQGFRKTIILNKALQATTADYLIFTDGDCVPRNDFVQAHLRKAERGYFLSGGYFKLPMTTSEKISESDIRLQLCFNADWLLQNGLQRVDLKITAKNFFAETLNRLTTTKPTWNGHNASGWRSDLLRVNGFDERMQYGGEDRELGERLIHAGVKPKQIRYSAACLHLEHERGYVKAEMLEKNDAIRRETRIKKTVRTPFGIEKSLHDETNA